MSENFFSQFRGIEPYDYVDAVHRALLDDVKSYGDEIVDQYHGTVESVEDFADALRDFAWDDDGVTGNPSGSYWCNAWRAKCCLWDNHGILGDALELFGYEKEPESAETCDVLIRCYVVDRFALDFCEEEEFAEIIDGLIERVSNAD